MAGSGRRRQDLASWQAELSSSFVRLDVAAAGSATSLDARLDAVMKGKVRAALVDVVGEPHRVRRTRVGAAADEGGLLVSVQLQGTCVVRQAGREAHLAAGDIAWYDAARPYELIFPEGPHQQAVLQILPDQFFGSRSLLDHTAVRVSGNRGIGRALAPMLCAIPRSIEDVEVVQADRFAQIAVDLLLLSIPTPARVQAPDLLESMHEFIEAHSDDPELSPGRVAAEVHLSLGHLHRVFRRSDTTVSEFVMSVRLDRAAADLRDPQLAHWTVRDIAQRRGFKDPAHFSRAFASRYGVSPTTWRRSSGG